MARPAAGASPCETPPSVVLREDSRAGPPSDAELETFAAIYAELEKTSREFEQQMAAARTVEEAREIRCRRQRANEAAIRDHGWTEGRFNRVAAALNDNPALIERTLKLLESRS
jgi:hypothetical protein